jgi:hypothetical protein
LDYIGNALLETVGNSRRIRSKLITAIATTGQMFKDFFGAIARILGGLKLLRPSCGKEADYFVIGVSGTTRLLKGIRRYAEPGRIGFGHL